MNSEIRATWNERQQSCLALAVEEIDGWTEYNACLPEDEATPEALEALAWDKRNQQWGTE